MNGDFNPQGEFTTDMVQAMYDQAVNRAYQAGKIDGFRLGVGDGKIIATDEINGHKRKTCTNCFALLYGSVCRICGGSK